MLLRSRRVGHFGRVIHVCNGGYHLLVMPKIILGLVLRFLENELNCSKIKTDRDPARLEQEQNDCVSQLRQTRTRALGTGAFGFKSILILIDIP